jgi:hypothetical protein
MFKQQFKKYAIFARNINDMWRMKAATNAISAM